MSEIEPAMTPEEWGMALAAPPGVIYGFNKQDEGWMSCHRMAAMCLYRQPFGFTREDIATLKQAIDDVSNVDVWGSVYDEQLDALRSLLGRITALLPPEKP